MRRKLPTVCIVGGGHCGATAAKYLRSVGIECASFDSDARPVGEVGSLAAEYLDGFIERHRLAHLMHTGLGVERAVRTPNGTWEIVLQNGSTYSFDALLVTCKPTAVPVIPPIPGQTDFLGRQVHASETINPEDLIDQKVLVVGYGRPAERLATRYARYAERVVLCCDPRRGDTVLAPMGGGIRAAALLTRRGMGREALEGMVKRRLRVAGEPVTLDHHSVRFADGTVEAIDTVIYCTGSNPAFSFLDAKLQKTAGRDFSLYQRVFRPEIDNLLFVGSFLPRADDAHAVAMQALLAAEYLTGDYALPDLFRMRLEQDREWSVRSGRLFSGDPEGVHGALATYARQLGRELTRGRKRALKNNRRMIVPALAQRLVSLPEELADDAPIGMPATSERRAPDESRAASAAPDKAAATDKAAAASANPDRPGVRYSV